jgi:hypothetical protein
MMESYPGLLDTLDRGISIAHTIATSDGATGNPINDHVGQVVDVCVTRQI